MPGGLYLLKQQGDVLLVLRISEGEPEAETFEPLELYPSGTVGAAV
jgi:hypothetical protein